MSHYKDESDDHKNRMIVELVERLLHPRESSCKLLAPVDNKDNREDSHNLKHEEGDEVL